MAQVEPLPLVPATVITGHSKRRPRRRATARTRSSPMSIVFGCSRSQCASHSCRDSMARIVPAAAWHHFGMAITLYGIPNCDTVKKARAWLGEQGVAYAFHDFKKQGVPPARL